MKVLEAKYFLELTVSAFDLCSVVNFAKTTKFCVIWMLLNNVHWCFPVFEYLQSLFIHTLSNKMQGEGVNIVVDNFSIKSENNLKPEFYKSNLDFNSETKLRKGL